MRRPFGMSEEDYQDARSEFAGEDAARAARRAERCTCNSRSESPCAGCERRAERAEHEARAEAESQRHADAEATHAVGGDFERCEDCGQPFAPHDLDAGVCAACKPLPFRRAVDGLRPGETLQEAMGLADEDIPF